MPACDLRLVTSGGAGEGIGHLARCAAIARAALARGLRVQVAARADAAARPVLADLPCAPWDAAERVAAGVRWLVLDTRRPIDAELAAARRTGARTLVLDRLDHADDASWTVIPALHAPPVGDPAPPRVDAGAAWVPLPEPLRRTRVAPWPGERDVALVTLGGADPRRLTEPVCRALAEVLQAPHDPAAPAPPALHCILGPALAGREALRRRLAARGWSVHDTLPLPELAALFERTRVAVAGFGTTVHQLAHFAVPCVTVTHHHHDLADAARLESLGVGRLGGDGEAFDPEAFAEVLRKSLADPTWCRTASARARALAGDGRGAERMLDRMFGGAA